MLRTCLVQRDDYWVETKLRYLEVGERFMMFEPVGPKGGVEEPVVDPDGNTEWIVRGKPIKLENGVWSVQIKEST
jgi:hypothetical protein